MATPSANTAPGHNDSESHGETITCIGLANYGEWLTFDFPTAVTAAY